MDYRVKLMPAVYDNPDTGCREIYVHGHLVTYYTEQELNFGKGYYFRRTPVQEQFMNYAQRFGDFREGAVHGEAEHMPADPLATTLHPHDTSFTVG
jgi:hypothetical protein